MAEATGNARASSGRIPAFALGCGSTGHEHLSGAEGVTKTRARTFLTVLLACACATLAATTLGCRSLGQIFYFLQPRQWVEPEFAFEAGRMAVLIEPARAEIDNPVFSFAFQQRLTRVLREHEVKVEVVPFDQMQSLRQANPDFDKWSLQKLGREANVNFVLYLRLGDLHLVESPDYPLITPRVQISAKLVGVDEPDDAAVLWPKGPAERDGRRFAYHRDPVERTGPDAIDREARNLGIDAAERIARYFYKYDAEESAPRSK